MKKYSLPVKILISVMMLAVLARSMNRETLGEIAMNIHASAWAMALGMMMIQIFALSVRWADLVNLQERKISYRASYRITVASQLANILLITSIGGVVGRIALAAQSGIDMVRAVCATIADRLMTVAALALLAALVLPQFHAVHNNAAIANTLPIFIAAFTGAGVIAVLLFRKILGNLKISARLDAGLSYLRNLAANKASLIRLVPLSLAAQICYFAAVYFVSRSANANIQFPALLVALPVITLIASLPISIGGWGVREGAFVYGLGLLGVPMETAFLISVQIGLISILATVVSGIPALLLCLLLMAILRRRPLEARLE